MLRIRFASGGPAEIPDCNVQIMKGLDHAVAAHIVRRVPRLKKGRWFVQVAQDMRGGFIGFYGSDDRVQFEVK